MCVQYRGGYRLMERKGQNELVWVDETKERKSHS